MGVKFPEGPPSLGRPLGSSLMLVFPPHHPDETLRSLASPSSLQGPELHGWRPPVDCVQANELCAAESNCSSCYRTLRQCLAGRDRSTVLANKDCQAALDVLQESLLYDCRCKRGMKKELQCLQIYWSTHLGLTEVFQQKAARRQSDIDKFHGPPKKKERARMESPAFSTPRGCLATGQEELILLQERVKNGKMTVDEALEKFKHWQMGKSGLEMIQQEKLRQLRDCIIGKRPEEENVCDKLTFVHHPSGNETAHNENMLYNIPFNNKFPAQLQVEKEFGFCLRKDH